MQVILTKNVEKLGRKGEVRNVKTGYYRNYLSPNGLAIVVTKARMKWAEELQTQLVKEKEELAKQAAEIKKQLEGSKIVVEVKTTEKDTLYGSIGEKEIVKALEEQAKIKVEKKQIDLKEPIKKVGKYKIKVKLTEEIEADVNFEIKGKEIKKKESTKKKAEKKSKK